MVTELDCKGSLKGLLDRMPAPPGENDYAYSIVTMDWGLGGCGSLPVRIIGKNQLLRCIRSAFKAGALSVHIEGYWLDDRAGAGLGLGMFICELIWLGAVVPAHKLEPLYVGDVLVKCEDFVERDFWG